MAHGVAWSPRAIEDLEAIAQYISADSSLCRNGREDNPQYYAQSSPLSLAGRIVPELGDEIFVCGLLIVIA